MTRISILLHMNQVCIPIQEDSLTKKDWIDSKIAFSSVCRLGFHLWWQWDIFRLWRDVLLRKLSMKTLKVIGLMHALKAKLVHKWMVFLVCHDLAQYCYVTRFSFSANEISIDPLQVRSRACNTWQEYQSDFGRFLLSFDAGYTGAKMYLSDDKDKSFHQTISNATKEYVSL